MAEITKKKVLITDTILRDAHQSQAATRMRTDEMLPVLEQLDEIGYYSLEAWGGATFDTCLRFFERRSVGAPSHSQKISEKDAYPNVAARAEFARVSALCG